MFSKNLVFTIVQMSLKFLVLFKFRETLNERWIKDTLLLGCDN